MGTSDNLINVDLNGGEKNYIFFFKRNDCLTWVYSVLFVCVCVCAYAQCEDTAVSSVRSRNAEPPGPDSLRRREEALYADSRCVCFRILLL